jgi:hypothetical protein
MSAVVGHDGAGGVVTATQAIPHPELVRQRLIDESRRDRQLERAAHRARIRGKYTEQQQTAIRRVYEAVKVYVGTSGGNTCAKLLLGLYNGTRFPFDLTDLRLLDSNLYQAAMTVLHMDARHTYCEVHELLNAIYEDGCSTGAEFEQWAYHLKWGKRCKRDQLDLGAVIRNVDGKILDRSDV